MRKPSPVSCLEPRSLHSIGVRADVLFYHFFVGAEAAGGEHSGAATKFNVFTGFVADDARDATLFNDQSLRFDAVQVASTESLEAFFQLGEGASADVFFVNRCERNFAGLIEPDSPGRTVVDFDAAAINQSTARLQVSDHDFTNAG